MNTIDPRDQDRLIRYGQEEAILLSAEHEPKDEDKAAFLRLVSANVMQRLARELRQTEEMNTLLKETVKKQAQNMMKS